MTIKKGTRNATVNAAKNVTIDTTGGDVTIEDATVTAGDNMHIATTDTTNGGDVTIDTGVDMSAENNLTIEANNGVKINTVTADVRANNGDAVVIAHGDVVNMDKNTVLTAGQNVVIEAETGVALSSVNASTADGTVFVRTTNGSITDANENTTANVTAQKAAFSAENGSVGTVGYHVDTSVDAVAATSHDGVFVTEGDGVAVDAIPVVNANKVKDDGTVESHATSPVSGLSSTDNGSVILEATAGNIDVNQAVVANGANGNVLVAANADGGNITLGADVTAAQSATIVAGGKIDQNADVTATAGDAYVEALGGNVMMADGTTTEATAGNVRVAASDSVVLSAVNAANSASVKATDGSITDNTAAEDANVTAQKLRLEAGAAVGGAAAADIDISVNNVEIKVGTGAFVQNDKDLTVGGVDVVTTKKVSSVDASTSDVADADLTGASAAAGDIRIEANGEMTVAEDVTTTARPTGADADKAGNIRLESANGNLSVDAAVSGNNVTLASSGNTVVADGKKVDAAKDLYVMAGGDIGLNATGADKAAAGETMALVSGGAINASGLKTSVLYTSDNNGVTIKDAEVSKQAKSKSDGNIDVEFTGDATVAYKAKGFVKVSATGALTVDSAAGTDGSISVTEVVKIDDVTAANNGVKEVALVPADGGADSVEGVTSDNSYVSLKGASVTVNQAVAANGGNAVLESTADGVELNADVTAAQDATVLAKAGVSQNANVTATAGDAYVEAQGGDVTMKDGTATTAGNNARVAASGSVALSAVNAANSASVKATAGSITDNTAAEDANVTAQKLRLEAGTAVGGLDAANIDTKVGNVVIKAGTDAFVHNDGAVTVGGVTDVTTKRVSSADAFTTDVVDDNLIGAEATSGNLSLLADGKMTVAEVAKAGANAALETTAEGIELNEAVTAGQNATVLAKTSVDQNADVKATAGDAYVEAQGGNVTMKDGTATTAGNNARIAASENVALSTVTAANSASVKATNGSILDNTAGEAANVTAQKLRLEAGKAVGGIEAANVDTSVNNIEVKAGTDAFVHNDKAVTVGGVGEVTTKKVSTANASTSDVKDADLTGAEATSGNLSLLVDGKMTVAEAAKAGANAALETTAEGVELNATVTAGQNATVLAKTSVDQNAAVTATAGDAYVEAQNGNVTMKDGTTTTAGNNVRIAASENVALSAVNAANSASVKATAGSITDNTAAEAANVTAQKLRLEAGKAVGGTDAANVDTSVDNVEVKAGTDAFVHNDKAVTVGGVDGVATRKVSTADASTSNVTDADLTGAEATSGNLSLLADGKMTVNETATAGANAALETTAQGVELNAAVTAAQDATVLAKAGVDQNADVTATAGDVYVEAQGGNVMMKDGTTTTAGNNARIVASDNVALSAVNTANSASVKATAGSITDNTAAETANVTAQKLRLEAGTAVGGTGAANVDTLVDNVEVKAGTDAFVHNDKAVTVGGVGDVTTKKVSTANASTSNVTDGDLTGAEATSGNLSLLADGKMTVNETATAGANAALETTADGIELNAAVTAAQDATVLAKTGISQNADVTATAGDAYVEAQGGDVTMKNGTTTTAGNNARVAASGSVALSAVNAANSASVKATAGSITDNTAGEAANVSAQKLRLEAGTAVGGAGAADVNTFVDNIEIKAGTDAFVHNGKAVTIGGVDGVTTRKVSTADASTSNVADGNLTGAEATSGNLSIRADGNMTVIEAVRAAADGKDVTLEATSGGVQINAVVTAGNDATVRAVDSIGITGTVDAKATATLEGTGSSTVTTLAGSSVVKGSTVAIKHTTVSQTQGSKVAATMLDLQNAGKDTFLASTKNEVANVKGNARVLVLEDAVDLRVAPEGLTTTGNTRLETVGGKSITVDGKVNVTGNATMMSAGNLTMNSDVTVGGSSGNTLDIEASAGTVSMGSGVTASTAGGNIAVVAKNGDIEIANLDAGSGKVWLEAGGSIKTKNGEGETGISAGGAGMSADKIGDAGEGNAMQLNFDELSLSGTYGVYVENGKDATVVAVSQNGTTGAFNVNRVEKDGTITSKVPGTASQSRGASAEIGGVVSENGDVVLTNHGNILIDDGAQIKAKENVTVTADGNIEQSTTSISSDKKGVVGNVGSAEAGISGTTLTLDAGGTIGSGSRNSSTPLRVEGAVTATASGTAAVASNGGDLSATSISGTDVNVYAPGSINTGKITASRTLTVTAGDYENGEVIIDTKNLVVNRINGGHKPQLALFKTQGNKKPNVKNQPNDTIIFIDGRVAGGDIQTINKLGALEAFPVQTPELKSEQGVFGNPFFMHGLMDVSEPVALGIIDFLLLDPGAIMYDVEGDIFPQDADMQVSATGLSPEYSYRFLGKKKDAPQKPDASSDNENPENEKDKSE